MANHKLIRVHYANIVTYTFFYGCSCVFYIMADNNRTEGLATIDFHKPYFMFGVFIGLAGIFQVWNVLFIFYVLLKQTRKNKLESPEDAILKRKVPNIVFVQNQNLFNEALAIAHQSSRSMREEQM